MSAFPAVATVLGLSKEVAESGPLLATLALDPSLMSAPVPPPPAPEVNPEPMDIKTGDPVTQAVVDNIIGKLPTKKEPGPLGLPEKNAIPVKLLCETCNITVSSDEMLKTHYAGAKHAKKLKGKELIKEINGSTNSMFVGNSAQNGTASTEFTCKICNVSLNSSQQLQQHLMGSKHKNKANTDNSNTISVSNNGSGEKGTVKVNIGPNRLYCAACDVHVNSDLQLHQHITSSKHASKVNGKMTFNNRGTPYTRRGASRGGARGKWTNQAKSTNFNNSYNSYTVPIDTTDYGTYDNSLPPWKSGSSYGGGGVMPRSNRGSSWTPSSSGLGLGGGWAPQSMTPNPNQQFVSGGMLYTRRDI